MTSASELFSNWRSRAGRVSGPDLDSDPHASRPFVYDRDLLPVRRRRRGNSRRRNDAGVASRFHLVRVGIHVYSLAKLFELGYMLK